MLREGGHGDTRLPPAGTARRLELAEEQLQHGRLPGAVWADDTDLLPTVDAKVDAGEYRLTRRRLAPRRVVKGACLELDERPARRGVGAGDGEGEWHRVHGLRRRLGLELLDGLYPGLHQGRPLGVVPERVHKVLHVLSLCKEPLVLLDLVRKEFLLCLLVGIVVALVALELLVVHSQDVGHDLIKECAVMRHHKDRVRIRLQVVLQPEHGLQVQVVRGLVQHEDLRPNEQGGGDRRTDTPTAGH
mmetsp:Transcript_100067/g.288950  ORF Transcript_100067/g.288950 Transcript_100067/m.288950 type:complete len:245 (+) Transcript_100067:557-1291(+)